jgi:haloalkane dehalogenase
LSKEISATFAYEKRRVNVHGAELAFVDEGSGEPVLFLHGNPTSSYLWRNVMPYLAKDARIIAPDLIGMGDSEKIDSEYRYVDHYRYLSGFIEALGFDRITLVLHDWGSGLGFHWAKQNADKVKAIAFMEAIVSAVPSWDAFPEDFRELFQAFRTDGVGQQMIMEKNMFVEQVLPGAVVRGLTDDEMAVYRAPYRTVESRKPLWRWPNEIPIEGTPADVTEIVTAYSEWLRETELPKLLLHATPGGLIREPVVQMLKQALPNLETVDIGPGVHFVQEDNPHGIGEAIRDWYRRL